MMQNYINVKINTPEYVIGPSGERMTYQEWLEMRKAEMN